VAASKKIDTANLSFAEHVCLGLVVAGAGHGWAVVRELALDGDVGRVWQLSPQLTYRTIDQLHARGLIKRTPHTGSGARTKYRLAALKAGVRVSTNWLGTPVEHIRDVRLELLVKLTLRSRVSESVALAESDAAFLERQANELRPLLESASAAGSDDAVAIFRQESAQAIDRFLQRAIAAARSPAPAAPVDRSKA
jgi:DNA-binding PadR family transcriptional regulator